MWIAITLLACQAESSAWELQEIRRHVGTTADQAMGFFASSIQDVDQDGTRDYLVGSPGQRRSPKGKLLGGVELHSGATGKLLETWFGPHQGSHFGRIAFGVGDLTGDGSPEIAIGATKDSRQFKEGGSLSILEAKNGKRLHTWYGGEAFDKFGRCLAVLPVLSDQDSPKLLIGGYQPSGLHRKGPGYLRVYSAKGALFETLQGNLPRDIDE